MLTQIVLYCVTQPWRICNAAEEILLKGEYEYIRPNCLDNLTSLKIIQITQSHKCDSFAGHNGAAS